jgi:hypothetical protein
MRINKAQGQTISIVGAYLSGFRTGILSWPAPHCVVPSHRKEKHHHHRHQTQGEGLYQDFEEAKKTNLKKPFMTWPLSL